MFLVSFIGQPVYAGSGVKKAKNLCFFVLKALYGWHDPKVRLDEVALREREMVPELNEDEALVFTLSAGRKIVIVKNPKQRGSEYIDLTFDREQTTRVQIQHMPAGTSQFQRMLGYFNDHYKTLEFMADWQVEKIKLTEDGRSVIDILREAADTMGTTDFFSHEQAMRSLGSSLGEVVSSESIDRKTKSEHLASIAARSLIHGQKMAMLAMLSVGLTIVADKTLYEGKLLSSTNLIQQIFPVEYSVENSQETTSQAYHRIIQDFQSSGQYAQAQMVEWLKEVHEAGRFIEPSELVKKTIVTNQSQKDRLPLGIQLLTERAEAILLLRTEPSDL